LKKDDRKRKKGSKDEDEDVEMENTEVVDVEFTFTGPDPKDFHSLKHLLSQLLSTCLPIEYDYSGLADLIIAQKDVGNFVRNWEDDEEEEDEMKEDENVDDGQDPYAFLTVLNLNSRKDETPVKDLITSLKQLSNSSTELQKCLESLDSTKVGLVVGERLINMPLEIIPQLYRLLGEDMKSANETSTGSFDFDKLIFLSRVYVPPKSSEDLISLDAESSSSKHQKKKKKNSKNSKKDSEDDFFTYHPESLFISKFSSDGITTKPKFQKDSTQDDDSTPGVETALRIMLVDGKKWEEILEGMESWMTSQ